VSSVTYYVNGFQASISSTFYALVFYTKLPKSFCQSQIKLEKVEQLSFIRKTRAKNVDEIDTRPPSLLSFDSVLNKKHFFPEGGDKEKLECFVDFCEDAIFEMQHAESLMKADDSGGGKKESSGPSLPSEDAPRYLIGSFVNDVTRLSK
jgi:hypothetical protein